ncbi:imidazolonepropionase, partial [Streptomyces albidoflavus]
MLGAAVTVALSTDCNPGAAFTSSVPFCVALPVRDIEMPPDEDLRTAPARGAPAPRRADDRRLARGA